MAQNISSSTKYLLLCAKYFSQSMAIGAHHSMALECSCERRRDYVMVCEEGNPERGISEELESMLFLFPFSAIATFQVRAKPFPLFMHVLNHFSCFASHYSNKAGRASSERESKINNKTMARSVAM